MLKAFRTVLLAAAATLLVAATLPAQSNPGSLHGRVLDESGLPVPGAAVSLVGIGAPHATVSDAAGFFRFARLAPGTYTVVVALSGFKTVTLTDVAILGGRLTRVDVPLPLAALNETIMISCPVPLIDPGRIDTGQTFSGPQLTEMPTSRDVWSLIQQVPGVQLDTIGVAGNTNSDIGGPSLISKGSGNVAYLVDGATITDNTYGWGLGRQNGGTSTFFDFSTIQDVEVVTGGGSLEQQTSGVTINVVTKRGTNLLKGSGRYLYASAAWQSTNTPQQMVDTGLQSNFTRFIREYGAELGGPILKDRLWLWAAAGREDLSLSPTTFNEGEVAVPEGSTLAPWSAKLNAQISGANFATLYYQRSARNAYNQEGFPDRPPPTRLNLLVPTDFYKVEDANVFSADLFASAFLTYQYPRYSSLPVGGIERNKQYYDGSYQQSWEYYDAREPQKQANLQVSRFFATGSLSHELRFGFNYRQQIPDSTLGLPGNQTFGAEFAIDDTAAEISRGVRRIYDTEFWSGTLGDTVTAGNLTLALGVRYDLQRGKNLPSTSFQNPPFENPCTQCGLDGKGSFPGLPEVKYGGADGWQFQYANWQPRASATWALGEKKTTLLRASYARFADQLAYLTYWVSGVPERNGYYYSWVDLNHDHDVQPDEIDFDALLGWVNGIDPAKLPTPPNRVEPGFKTPSTDEIIAGIDHQVADGLAVSATFSYRNTKNLQSAVPIGATASDYVLGGHAAGVARADDGFVLAIDEPYYRLDLSPPPSGFELQNRPGASQRYYGVDLSVVKQLSSDWTVRANVGWNSFRRHLTPQSLQNPNNLWDEGGQNDDGGVAAGLSSRFNVWLNASWQFNVSGLYQGPWGLAFGANFFGRQGYPRPYYVRVQLHDENEHEAFLLIDRMDTYRFANVYQLDLRLARPFQAGPVTITPAVELFNVANGNTVFNNFPQAGWYDADNEEQPFIQDAFFNRVIDVQSPRIVRLGVQIAF